MAINLAHRQTDGLANEDRNALIRAVQAGVPFVRRPFAQLGETLGVDEARVLEGLRSLSAEKVLREISAVLEGSLLGWDSALVAGTVEPDAIAKVADVVSAHPTVTHNYLREHDLNLWFTIAVPPEMNLERTLWLLAVEAGVRGFYPLRRTHTFKIGVNFDPERLQNATTATVSGAGPSARPIEVGPREVGMLRALQTPLPLVPQPFDEFAAEAGVEVDELLGFAKNHLGGVIRRYVGTLRHRKLGVRDNGMVVWKVRGERIAGAGATLAAAPEVSHCYARSAIPGFPYSLYSMVHGPDRETCRAIASQLAERVGIDEYAVLFSEREFKKVRLRYFLPELDEWWAQRNGTAA